MSQKIPTLAGYEEWNNSRQVSDPPVHPATVWAAAVSYKRKQTLKILEDQITLLDSYNAQASSAAVQTIRDILTSIDEVVK